MCGNNHWIRCNNPHPAITICLCSYLNTDIFLVQLITTEKSAKLHPITIIYYHNTTDHMHVHTPHTRTHHTHTHTPHTTHTLHTFPGDTVYHSWARSQHQWTLPHQGQWWVLPLAPTKPAPASLPMLPRIEGRLEAHWNGTSFNHVGLLLMAVEAPKMQAFYIPVRWSGQHQQAVNGRTGHVQSCLMLAVWSIIINGYR